MKSVRYNKVSVITRSVIARSDCTDAEGESPEATGNCRRRHRGAYWGRPNLGLPAAVPAVRRPAFNTTYHLTTVGANIAATYIPFHHRETIAKNFREGLEELKAASTSTFLSRGSFCGTSITSMRLPVARPWGGYCLSSGFVFCFLFLVFRFLSFSGGLARN